MSARSVTPSRIFAATLRSTVTSYFSAAARAGNTIAAHNAIHAIAAQTKAVQAKAARPRPKRTNSLPLSLLVFSMGLPPLLNPSRQCANRASVGRLFHAVKVSLSHYSRQGVSDFFVGAQHAAPLLVFTCPVWSRPPFPSHVIRSSGLQAGLFDFFCVGPHSQAGLFSSTLNSYLLPLNSLLLTFNF